jgi:type II secretory pathway pseudopilin PulG
MAPLRKLVLTVMATALAVLMLTWRQFPESQQLQQQPQQRQQHQQRQQQQQQQQQALDNVRGQQATANPSPPTAAALRPPPVPPPQASSSPPQTQQRQSINNGADIADAVVAAAARNSDPQRVHWGAGVTLRGPPPAIVVFAPHKTGSTFFTAFLHDLASMLGLCWYTDNAAFMYAPPDHAKCASPSCGHLQATQRRFQARDNGWGDCAGFASDMLAEAGVLACAADPEAGASKAAATAAATPSTASTTPPPPLAAAAAAASTSTCSRRRSRGSRRSASASLPRSAAQGVAWGVVRLPPAMRTAISQLGTGPWKWYMMLHQRSPSDTLVSGYHSFGWTHPAAPGASSAQRATHASLQSAIRNVSADQYALSHAAELRGKYAPYLELLYGGGAGRGTTTGERGRRPSTHAADAVLIRSRYEELVTAFPRWLSTFLNHRTPACRPPAMNICHPPAAHLPPTCPPPTGRPPATCHPPATSLPPTCRPPAAASTAATCLRALASRPTLRRMWVAQPPEPPYPRPSQACLLHALYAVTPSYSNATLRYVERELLKRHRKSFRADGKHRRSITPGRAKAGTRCQRLSCGVLPLRARARACRLLVC